MRGIRVRRKKGQVRYRMEQAVVCGQLGNHMTRNACLGGCPVAKTTSYQRIVIVVPKNAFRQNLSKWLSRQVLSTTKAAK